MTEDSVLLVGKVIGRVKNGVFDLALISHVTDDEFNEMSLFDVWRVVVDKETFLRTIYDNSHPNTHSIQENASLERSDQGVTYNLDDVISNDYDFEGIKKQSHHLILKRRTRMKNIIHK